MKPLTLFRISAVALVNGIIWDKVPWAAGQLLPAPERSPRAIEHEAFPGGHQTHQMVEFGFGTSGASVQ